MGSNFEKRSEVVRAEDFGTSDTQDHPSPIRLRIKPDRRQRNVPVLPHPDRRKRASTAPVSGPPAGGSAAASSFADHEHPHPVRITRSPDVASRSQSPARMREPAAGR
jgi:hypothetical protein